MLCPSPSPARAPWSSAREAWATSASRPCGALSATEIIVVDRSAEALEHAKGWGADHVVLARADRSHVEEIKDLTDGLGAEVVIDYVGEGGAELDAIDVLQGGGTDFVVGYGGKIDVDILQVVLKEINFVGTSAAPTTSSSS